ncbi:MAG TPA: phospholipase D-like domain-containing protein, partial [Candidatus Wallbacteria bacterium]|nr:phospholipase D-like domain-containing protein [Candidatus Wallbacteria bacterium]
EALENFEISKDLFGNWSGKDKELIAAEKAMDMWIKGMGPLNDPVLKEVNAELFKYKKMVNYQGYDPFENSHYAAVKLYGKHNFQQERNDITDNLVAFMDACTQEIIVQNPYVILTEKSRAALKRASDRGVKIIIHTNSPVSTDSILTQAFFLKDWKEVMQALPNARVFVFVGKNKLHAKVFVFDKTVSVVGTYNMDYMSEQINGEDVCAIKSAEFSKDCRDRIFEDIAQSKEYKIGINEKGEAYEIYGPGSFTDKKTMFILETLMKLNILKPLI